MRNPIINDRIVSLLKKGEVNVVQSMKSVNSEGEVGLADGEVLKEDTIILCTGYTYDYSLIPAEISPIRNPNAQ